MQLKPYAPQDAAISDAVSKARGLFAVVQLLLHYGVMPAPVGTENSVRADSTGLKARVVPPLPVVGNPRLQAGFDRRFLDDQATRKRGFSSDSLDRRGTASRSICVAEKAAAGLFAALEERHTQ